MLIALNVLMLAWLIVTWVKRGFFAALNLFAYGVVASLGTVYYLQDLGRLAG